MQRQWWVPPGVGITCHCLSWKGSLTYIYRRFFHAGRPHPGRSAAREQRHPSTTVSVMLGAQWLKVYLATVFRNKLILLNWFFDEGAPPCNIRWSQKQVLKKRETRENDKIHVRRIISYNWSFKIKQCLFKCPCIPFSGLFGCCSSCRTPLCCPSGLQHHRSCTDLGHTPSQPGSRDTVWCCTASYICSLGSGSDLKSRQNTWLHQLGREYSSNKHRAYKDYQLCCLAVHNISQIKANLQGSTAQTWWWRTEAVLSAPSGGSWV